jgi:subtilase family serine protease
MDVFFFREVAMIKKITRSLIFLSIAFFALQTTSIAQAAGRQQLHGHIPAAIQKASLAGPVPANQKINLSIGFPLRHQETLQYLLKSIYDPKSPNYRSYLTSEKFGEMFGAPMSDYQAVIKFATDNNLTVTGTYLNRVLISVTGNVADIERAFNVTLNTYSRLDGGKFYAPDQEPSVDLDVPILHVSGLDNSSIFHHHNTPGNLPTKNSNTINNRQKIKPSNGTGGDCGQGNTYIGNDFRNIYVPCTSLDGHRANGCTFRIR